VIHAENASSAVVRSTLHFGECLRAGPRSTGIAAEDRESYASYAGSLDLPDLDDRFQLYPQCTGKQFQKSTERHQRGNLR
jgi:hypothetical protein